MQLGSKNGEGKLVYPVWQMMSVMDIQRDEENLVLVHCIKSLLLANCTNRFQIKEPNTNTQRDSLSLTKRRDIHLEG